MPPMPILAQRRPARGSGAGTLQKQSCAASRRLDHEASSEGALWLGDGDGDGDGERAVAAAAAAGCFAASTTCSDAHPSAPNAASATTRSCVQMLR